MTAIAAEAVIEEARRRAKRRRMALAGLAAFVVVAGGIWAALSLTGGEGVAPPPVPAGYHAVRAKGPVQHELLTRWSRTAVNGIPTGRRTRTDAEVWFDPRVGLVRERGRTPGHIYDGASRCPCGFPFERYWPVDSKDYVRHPGTGTFHGREVIWIGRRQTGGFAPYSIHFGEWVALDAQTHQPVATRTYVDEGQLMAEQRVVKRLPDVDQNSFWFVVPDTRPTG